MFTLKQTKSETKYENNKPPSQHSQEHINSGNLEGLYTNKSTQEKYLDVPSKTQEKQFKNQDNRKSLSEIAEEPNHDKHNLQQKDEVKMLATYDVRRNNSKRRNKREGNYEQQSETYTDIQKRKKLPDFLKKALVSQAKNSKNYKAKPTQQKTMKKSKIGSMILSSLKKQQNSCEICVGIISKKDTVYLCQCAHIFCKECIRQYVTYKIKRFEQVVCPNQNCDIVMNQNTQFYNNLSNDLQKQYTKIHQFYKASKDPTLKLCPKDNCDGIIKITEESNQVCGSCKRIFCAKCYFEEHQGQCDKNQIDFLQNNLHFKQCGNCGMVVQRTEGCNHMTCKCKYQFCYVCGKKWTAGHACNIPRGNSFNDLCCCAHGVCCQQLCGQTCTNILLFPLRLVLSIVVIIVVIIIIIFGIIRILLSFLISVIVGIFCSSVEYLCNCSHDNCCFGLLGVLFFPVFIVIGLFIGLCQIFPEMIEQPVNEFIQNLVDGMSSVWYGT